MASDVALEQLVANLIACVDLTEIRLISTEAKLTIANVPPKTDGLVLSTTPTASRGSIVDESHLYCGVRFESKLVQSERPKAKTIMLIKAEYGLFYRLNPESTNSPEAVAVFAERNGVFNAWPFFRELVHTTACRMGFSQVVIPSLRIPPKP